MSAPSWYLGDAGSAKRPPRANLVRNSAGVAAVRAAPVQVPDAIATIAGHAAVFSTPTEISSAREGRFIESIAPGAFRAATANPAGVRVLLQHGRDVLAGERPIAALTTLREDQTGLYYEAALLDTWVNRELLAPLKAGLMGASFRFSVLREDYTPKPARTASNPEGLPTRVVREVELFELGPVTWGAYSAATAGVKPSANTIDLAGNSTGSVAASKEPRRTLTRPSWYLPDTPPPRRKSYLTKASPYL